MMRKVHPVRRYTWKRFFPRALLIGAGSYLFDCVWISLLAPLDISFGSPFPDFFMFAFAEGGIFVLCTGVWAWLKFFRKRSKRSLPLDLMIVLNVLLAGIGIYGFFFEPFRLTVSHVELKAPGLSRAVRIVQLSDIHVERTTRREAQLPTLVESLNPDMIVLTGDYLNETFAGDDQARYDFRDLIGQLHAPLGIYAVNGNVEEPWMMPILLKNTDAQVLDDEVVRIPELGEHFALVGLDFVHQDTDAAELQSLVKQLEPDDFSILLYHKPDLAYVAQDLNIDLYLAGHTHGGQVRLPIFGAIITNSEHGKAFEMGLYHLGDMALYVTRGLGMTGGVAPRIRILCPPEVVVIDLVPGE